MVSLIILMIDDISIQKSVPRKFWSEINTIHLIEALILSYLLFHIIRLTAALNFKLHKPSKYVTELGIIPMEEDSSYALAYHVSQWL